MILKHSFSDFWGKQNLTHIKHCYFTFYIKNNFRNLKNKQWCTYPRDVILAFGRLENKDTKCLLKISNTEVKVKNVWELKFLYRFFYHLPNHRLLIKVLKPGVLKVQILSWNLISPGMLEYEMHSLMFPKGVGPLGKTSNIHLGA